MNPEMINEPGKKHSKADVALVALFAVVCIFCLAIMVYFLIRYPIPWSTANGKGGLVVILIGFAYLGNLFWPHLGGKVLDENRKTAVPAPGSAPKLGWKGIPLLERIGIIIGIPIFVAAIIFTFGAIIWGFLSGQLP